MSNEADETFDYLELKIFKIFFLKTSVIRSRLSVITWYLVPKYQDREGLGWCLNTCIKSADRANSFARAWAANVGWTVEAFVARE